MIDNFIKTTGKLTTSTKEIFIPKEEFTEEIRTKLDFQLKEFLNEVLNKEIPQFYLYKEISSRVKTVESMNRKLVAKNRSSWKECSDYCGVAIILHPYKSIKDLMEILNKLHLKYPDFKLVKEENIGPKDTSSFGYRATHVDSLFKGFKYEIQIRTIYQDVLNVISHNEYEIARLKGYDQAHSLPREIHQISSLMEVSENISNLLIRDHSKEIPIEKIESPNDLKLIFTKKLKYTGIVSNWEFEILYQVCKTKTPIEVSDKWNQFIMKFNNNTKHTSIFNFVQFLFFGDLFDPNSIDLRQTFELFDKFKGVLSNLPLLK